MNTARIWLADLEPGQLVAFVLLVKITIVLAAAWLLQMLLGNSNPRWRRLVWRVCAVGTFVVIGLVALPPLLSWRVLPAQDVAATAIEETTPRPASQHLVGSAPHAVGNARYAANPGSTNTPASQGLDPARHSTNSVPTDSQSTASQAARPNDVSAARTPSGKVSGDAEAPQAWAATRDSSFGPVIAHWPLLIWGLGVLLITMHTLVGLRRLVAMRRRSAVPPEWLVDQAQKIANRLGCRRLPAILLTTEITSPCVMGARRPVILLPALQCDSHYREELPAILAHEISHVIQRDLIWNLVLHDVSIVWWFHPLAWRIRSVHAGACDGVCDAIAADYIGDVAGYGRTLARLAIRVIAPKAIAGMAMAQTSHVRRRIEALGRRIYAAGLPRTQFYSTIITAFLALVSFASLGISRVQAEPEPKPAAPQPASSTETKQEQAPGEEPDETDAATLGIAISVSNDAGIPIDGAQLQFSGWINDAAFNRKLQTAGGGVVFLRLPAGAKVSSLWMTCKSTGSVPIHYVWRSENRPIELPRNLDLRMTAGSPISGIVQDEQGQPVEGAKVTLHLPPTWPKLANYIFEGEELTTDAQGRWSWDSAPKELGELGIGVSHSDFLKDGVRPIGDRKYVAVLKQGLIVSGRVTDPAGQPVKNAAARLGFDQFGSSEPTTGTDSDGRFVLKNCKPGKSLVTVQADGFCPQFKDLAIGEAKGELTFQLEPGHIMRVRVIDADGAPISGASFCADTWRGFRTLSLRIQTDAEGRATWNGAPPDTVLCDFLGTGYMAVRQTAVKAGDEETVIPLPPLLIISGKVVDAVTGQPIPEFRIRRGYMLRASDRVIWSRDEAIKYTDGKYSFKIAEPVLGHYLQFVAEGYKPVESRQFESTEGKQSFDVELQPDGGSSAIVLLPNGEPATGAEIAVATREKHAVLTSGRFDRSSNSAEVITADSQGRFKMPSPDDKSYLLLVTHDGGYSEVTSKDFLNNSKIQLQAWGSIEGRVMTGRQPDANRVITFWPHRTGSVSSYVFSYSYTTKADSDGRFKIDRVMPGPGYVARVVVTDFLSSSLHSVSWQVPVEIQPNMSTSVTIGGAGRPVVGQMKLDRQPDFAVDWTANEPAMLTRKAATQDQPDVVQLRCGANMDRTGRFLIPDVPAGEYKLFVPVNNPPTPNACGAGNEIGRATLEVVVPPMSDDRSDEPLDLGVVTATLLDTLDAGEEAPLFVLPGVHDGTVRLAELRGKLVVLDFWATWCGPCMAEMPTLKEIQKQYTSNPRFALVGLSCDQQLDAARRCVAENSLDWTQAHAGASGAGIGGTAEKYTVRALPATFLIGPDGRVLAKNLHGEGLTRAIATALKDDKLFEAAKAAGSAVRFPVVRFDAPAEAPLLAEKPAVVVMDDSDPNFDKTHAPTDAIHLYGDSGTVLWTVSGLNSAQTVGASKRVSIDRERGRIYFCETVANRITALDFHGRKLWQVDHIEADTLTIDSKTGNIWASGGRRLNEGETVVFDPTGNEIATFPYRAIDIVYDPHSDAFWLVGYQILQLDRKGDVKFRLPFKGWCCPCIAVNSTDGSAWIGERNHPDVESKNRLWLVDANGKVRQQIDLGEIDPFSVACDPKTGDAWVGTFHDIRRVTPKGEFKNPLAIEANNISFSPTTSAVWVTTKDALLKLDNEGETLARHAFEKPSQQVWLLAF